MITHFFFKMSKIISLFNHKGGVGKTTFTYNLAWKLAENGKKVLLIDADPQQNLSSFVHGFSDEEDYTLFTNNIKPLQESLSIYEYLAPKFFQSVEEVKKPLYMKDNGKNNLFLLRGDISLSEFDVEFAYAIQSNSKTSSHLPVAFEKAIKDISKDYDYTLIDMSPNLGMLNMFTLMSSHYFIVPLNPSFFCLQALENLQSVLKDWDSKINKYRVDQFNKIGIKAEPKFLGIISQNFRPLKKNENATVNAFNEWFKKIDKSALDLFEILDKFKMTISKEEFSRIFNNKVPFVIDTIPDMNKVKVISEEYGKPIFALSNTELTAEGLNQTHYNEQINAINNVFQFIVNSLEKLPSQ